MSKRHDNSLHNHSVAGAHAILDIFAPLLREEERGEALGMVYAACRAMLESFALESRPEAARLKPGRN